MEIVLGVGIPAAVLVAIALGYHIYKWIQNTLDGRLLAGTLYAAVTHHTRKRQLEANLAKTGAILSNLIYVSPDNKERLESHRGKEGSVPSNGTLISIEDQETLHILKTVAEAEKKFQEAAKAVHNALEEEDAASKTVNTLREEIASIRNSSQDPTAKKGELETAERTLSRATQAYTKADLAKKKASSRLQSAQTRAAQLPQNGTRRGFFGEPADRRQGRKEKRSRTQTRT